MSERLTILRSPKNWKVATATAPKSTIARLAQSFNERFDAVTNFVYKWTIS